MAVVVAELLAKLTLNKSGFDRGMNDAKTKIMGFDTSLNGVKKSWGDFFNAAQVAAVPIGAAMAKGVNDAMNFDSALAQITARTGVTGDALDQVRSLAIEMGKDTKFSALDAANAMLELLSSGDDIDTAMGRLPHVLNLAASGSLDLKSAADGLTDVMAAFGIEADDSADIVQSLFAASASSSATVQDLIDGFANVGPVARTFGLDVDDAAAYLATLAENGIKGSEAGTALKSMLLNMTRTTEETQGAWAELGISMYDAQGNTRDLNTVLNELDAALKTKTPEEQNELMKALGGSYGIVALSALRASGGITQMKDNMSETATAGDVAQASMETFEGKLTSLQGSIETLNVSAFTPFMNNVLKPIVEDFQSVIDQVIVFTEKNPELTQTVLTVAGAFVIGTGALTLLGIGISTVTTGITALITTALSPLGLALAVGAILVGAYLGNWMGFRDWVDGTLRPLLDDIWQRLQRWHDVLTNIKTIIDGIMNGDYDIGEVISETVNSFGSELAGGGFDDAYQATGRIAAPSVTANAPGLGNVTSILLDTAQWVGDVKAGRRAMGGGVRANTPYMVGEEGPELFVPDSSGEIVPNGGGMGAPVINVYQQPGEDGAILADRIAGLMVSRGILRAA